MLLIILSCICAILIGYIILKPHCYWKERGAVHEKPWPFFGSLIPVLLQKQSLAERLQDVYNKFPLHRYVGLYQFLIPTLILRDPDLIKQITVKAFESFPEHIMITSEKTDPLWAKTLFAMPGGDEWRVMRAILSPAFTSSKLRNMFHLITTCAKQFTDHFVQQGNFINVDIKDAFSKVTNDIIATTAFGVTCDSLKDSNNKIFLMGKDVSDLNGFLRNIKFFLGAVSPSVAQFFGIRFINKESGDFFAKIIKETMRIREEKEIVRPDMIHLMMQARKQRLAQKAGPAPYHVNDDLYQEEIKETNNIDLTDDVLTSQALVFFLAGYDTVSTAMSYATYELALNPHIQDILREEVDRVLESSNGEVSHEELVEMKYLDMVVAETLRKWPPFAVTDRRPIRPFTIEPRHPHEKPLTVDSKMVCQIPIYSIHRDPKFYPNPEKFEPERFSDENKHKIKPFTYLPFGSGPRNCIGSRFALLEIKVVIFHLMSEFEIVPVRKTNIPLKLSKTNVNPVPDPWFWLGLKRRSQNCLKQSSVSLSETTVR